MLCNLSYVGFVSPAAEDWRAFATDVLGAQVVDDGPDGEVRLRIDDQSWRIAVHPGAAHDVAYFGWEARDAASFADVVARAAVAGLAVTEDEAVAGHRDVDRLAWFEDSVGFRHEIVLAPAVGAGFEPSQAMNGPFVTGEGGVGHVVLMVPDIEAAERFLIDVLGLVISDFIGDGEVLDLRFFHCPGAAARHHTIALSEVPGMRGMHHLMIEVADIDDVGLAYDRARAAGHVFAMDYGKHPNDQMTSFYVRTPSGFELEYGAGGVVIDDATWEPARYDSTSIWGHNPPDQPVVPQILRPV